jgi:hypothetical protein
VKGSCDTIAARTGSKRDVPAKPLPRSSHCNAMAAFNRTLGRKRAKLNYLRACRVNCPTELKEEDGNDL